jgi:hypothetical protein
VNPVSGSPYTFYDVSCPAASPNTTTPSSLPTATTTFVTTSSATTTTKTLPTSTPECGVAGYDNGTPSYNFDSSGNYGTFAACSAKCFADNQCFSFAIGAGDCLLYTTSVYVVLLFLLLNIRSICLLNFSGRIT